MWAKKRKQCLSSNIRQLDLSLLTQILKQRVLIRQRVSVACYHSSSVICVQAVVRPGQLPCAAAAIDRYQRHECDQGTRTCLTDAADHWLLLTDVAYLSLHLRCQNWHIILLRYPCNKQCMLHTSLEKYQQLWRQNVSHYDSKTVNTATQRCTINESTRIFDCPAALLITRLVIGTFNDQTSLSLAAFFWLGPAGPGQA